MEVDDHIQLPIGRPRDPWAPEEYYLRITTPEALLAQATVADGVLVDRATLIITRYDPEELAAYLKRLVASCEGSVADTAIPALQQYFRWGWDKDDRPPARELAPLELRDITGPDGRNFRSLRPWDNDEVDYAVEMTIGRGHDEANFGVRIVTPAALLTQPADEFRVLAHGAVLVVDRFDWRELLPTLEDIVSRSSANLFSDSVWSLRRYFAVGR